MQGNYIDQIGNKFEVTQHDLPNRIAYAFCDGSGQWYPESVYLKWSKSGDISKTAVYEPEIALTPEPIAEVVIEEPIVEVPEVIEEIVEEIIPEPIPEVIEEHAINEYGEDAVVPEPVVEKKIKKTTTKKKTK